MRRFIRLKRLALGLLMVFALAVGVKGISSALDISYFDDVGGGQCDVWNSTNNPICGGSVNIWLMVGESQYVQKTTVKVRAYFHSQNGELTFYNYNYCLNTGGPDEVEDEDRAGVNAGNVAGGDPVTDYNITNAVGGQGSFTGKKFDPANSNCQPANNQRTVQLTGMTPAKGLKNTWFATITVTKDDQKGGGANQGYFSGACSGTNIGGCDGIKNSFSIKETGGSTDKIAQVGDGTDIQDAGYKVTAQEADGGPPYVSYAVRFGVDCDAKASDSPLVQYYDLDNAGGGGAQPAGTDITMLLYDVTNTGGAVTAASPSINWKPASNQNVVGQHGFGGLFSLGHSYIWVIRNVFHNNTIQFSTPYDGIYFMNPCNDDSDPTGTIQVTCDPTDGSNTVTETFSDPDGGNPAARVVVGNGKGNLTWDVANSGKSHTFTVDDGIRTDQTQPIKLYVTDTGPQGSGDLVQIQFDPAKTTKLCLDSAGCAGYSFDQDSIDPYTPFGLTVRVQTTSKTKPAGSKMELKITPRSGSGATWTYDQTSSTVDYKSSATGGLISHDFTPIGPTNQPGAWDITWFYTANDSSLNVSCPISTHTATFVVGFKPYVTVYGGDAMAGSYENNASHTCTTNKNAGFLTWNNEAPNYTGAGAQYAVTALGVIQDFATGLNANTAGNPSKPAGLAFANNGAGLVNAATGLFGGKFATSSPLSDSSCDFTKEYSGSISAAAAESMIHDPANSSLGNGEHVTIYATGTVYIDRNIVYNPITWSSVADIPSFKLVVVGGNIVIQNDVAELDGTYIAEPDADGNGGTITDCGDPSTKNTSRQEFNPTTDADFFTDCSEQLSVYGAMSAKQFHLLRTSNSIGVATNNTTNADNAAESFNYEPEAWLPRQRGSILKYNTISGLPPVL